MIALTALRVNEAGLILIGNGVFPFLILIKFLFLMKGQALSNLLKVEFNKFLSAQNTKML